MKLVVIFLLGLLCGVAVVQKERIVGLFQKKPVVQETILPTGAPAERVTATPVPDPKASWKIYTNTTMGFSVQHPDTLKPEEFTKNQVVFQLWGKTQKQDTEFYDGINISIEKRSRDGKNLADIVNTFRAGSLEVWGEPVGEIKPVSLGGFSGFTYDVQGHEYYYFDTNDGSYIEILNLTGDPEQIGYEQTAKDIISSFTKK